MLMAARLKVPQDTKDMHAESMATSLHQHVTEPSWLTYTITLFRIIFIL